MRQRKTIQLLGVVAAILLISVAYATIQSVNLTVTGNVTATPDQGNFKVAFTGTPTFEKSGSGTATLAITDDLAATMDVSGLKSVGDTLTANFTIANKSTDITAYLKSTVTNTNTEYFQVTSSLDSKELAPQTGTTVLHVTVKLIKTPVSGDQKDTLKVQVTASPTPITGDETETPTEPEGTITFTITYGDIVRTYTAMDGMFFSNWVDTEYNTDGWICSYISAVDGYMFASADEVFGKTGPSGMFTVGLGIDSWDLSIYDGRNFVAQAPWS